MTQPCPAPRPRLGAPPCRRSPPRPTSDAAVAHVHGLYVLVYAGESVKYAYLPIYMTSSSTGAALSGAVIGIQPLIELVIMPFAVIVARTIGMMRLMVVGAASASPPKVCFATTAQPQGCSPGRSSWAAYGALRRSGHHRRPKAAAVRRGDRISHLPEFHSGQLGACGLTGGLGVAVLGLPLVFIPAFFAVLAVIGLALMARTTHLEE